MSSKPSTFAEWDTNGTNLTPTTSGHKSDGWANNEIPTAAEFNHWQQQVSLWTKWLLDAELGDVILSSLQVTGESILDGLIRATGGTNFFDNDIDVTNDIAAGGDIVAGEDIVAGGVLQFAGTEKMPLSTQLAVEPAGSAHTRSRVQVIFAASTNEVYVPIIGLPIGAVLTGMKVWFKKGTSSSDEIQFDIVRNINNGADDFAGINISNSENAPGDVDDEVTGFEHEVESGYQYALRCDPSGSVAPAADRYYHAEIYWSKPAP